MRQVDRQVVRQSDEVRGTDRQTNRETDIWSHLRRKHFREARKSVSRAKLISSKHNNVNVI